MMNPHSINDLVLRKATADDSEFAYQVKKTSFKEYVEKIWGWDENEQRLLHKQRFKAQSFQIISLEGKDIGVMSTVITPECIKINQLYLLPEYQGLGIGTKCMKLIIEKSAQMSLPLRLRVLKVNKRALMFYQKLGFLSISETDTHILMQKNP